MIVSTSALFSRGLQLRAGSYEAAGGKLAPVGFERDKNARRRDREATGGAEKAAATAWPVYLNLNIMQIDRDKMNNNCNSRGRASRRGDDERRFILDKTTSEVTSPECLGTRYRHANEFSFRRDSRWVEIVESIQTRV